MSAAEEQPLSCPTLEKAWSDPAFMAQQLAERAEWQRQTHAMLTEAQERYWQRRRVEKGIQA